MTVTITGNFTIISGQAAKGIITAARRAVRLQTEETKQDARAVVARGLRATGRTRVANSIRSHHYPDTPAGFVHSSWGYFKGNQFVDILAMHERGGTINALQRMMFIPFGRRRRRGEIQFTPGSVNFIPTRKGVLVVPKRRGTGRGRPIGILVRSVTLPKRLDFTQVESSAMSGLEAKLLAEFAKI